jgi:transcriptional regulator with XRE-family HTH domain
MVDEKRLYAALGMRLKRLREAERRPSGKLTQSALAKEVGLERTSITNIERGNQKVPLHVLYRICEVLQVPVTDLLPTLGEGQSVNVSAQVGELTFQGRNVKTTPRVAQRLAELMNPGDPHEQDNK